MWEETSRIGCCHHANSTLWQALEVWIQKPHVLDRRLCGATVLCREHLSAKQTTAITSILLHRFETVQCFISKYWIEKEGKIKDYIPEFFNRLVDLEQVKEVDHSLSECSAGCGDKNTLAECADSVTSTDTGRRDNLPNTRTAKNSIGDNVCEELHGSSAEAVLRLLLPKQELQFSAIVEFILLDSDQCQAWFVPTCTSDLDPASHSSCTEATPYRISISQEDTRKHLVLQCREPTAVAAEPAVSLACSKSWLSERLLPRLAHWCEQEDVKASPSTLQLVDLSRYNHNYQLLKAKYAPRLIQIWPEKTDPQKFVYEDIAIAAYLLTLWEADREAAQCTDKQSFVDLGCGNGLLVHLLSSEGHHGLGLDVRRRKIWDLYPPEVKLETVPITPSEKCLFPEYDWLIGNHSDELTPWIPVLAARSSYKCQYFVLPCCPFDFHGKFGERHSGLSQYGSYLRFVELVGQKCGFHVSQDILRIPSTKRTCFVGRRRSYKQEEEAQQDALRTKFITERHKLHKPEGHHTDSEEHPALHKSDSIPLDCSSLPCNSDSEQTSSDCKTHRWVNTFEARSSEERVRNCTRVDQHLRETIIHTVFQALLQCNAEACMTTSAGKTWRTGGSLSLGDVAAKFDSEVLQQLKRECGGLQTLLRNHHQVFHVQGGSVKLRDWSSAESMEYRPHKKRRKMEESVQWRKTKLCWFYIHHPDGCPQSDEHCSFAHGENDLIKLLKTNLGKSDEIVC